MCAKFNRNLITHLHFLAVFCKYAKGRRKIRENEWLFEGSYLRNGWQDLLQIQYVFSPNMPAPLHSEFSRVQTKDHGVKNVHKIVLCSLYLYTYVVCAHHDLHDTLPCVLIRLLFQV